MLHQPVKRNEKRLRLLATKEPANGGVLGLGKAIPVGKRIEEMRRLVQRKLGSVSPMKLLSQQNIERNGGGELA